MKRLGPAVTLVLGATLALAGLAGCATPENPVAADSPPSVDPPSPSPADSLIVQYPGAPIEQQPTGPAAASCGRITYDAHIHLTASATTPATCAQARSLLPTVFSRTQFSADATVQGWDCRAVVGGLAPGTFDARVICHKGRGQVDGDWDGH